MDGGTKPLKKAQKVSVHRLGAKNYQKVTDTLIRKLLKATGLSLEVTELSAFKELVFHLNPLATFSSAHTQGNITQKLLGEVKEEHKLKDTQEDVVPKEQSLEKNELPSKPKVESLSSFLERSNESPPTKEFVDPLPTAKRADPPCIMCQAPSPTIRSVLLNVNDTAKILMAAVMTEAITFDYATKAVCNYPLRMCISHVRPVYDMMVNVIGAKTEFDLGLVRHEKLTPAMEMYKQLKSVRDTMDGKQAAKTQIGSFKMAIRTFYKCYTPKDVVTAAKRERSRVDQMNDILKNCPADINVSEYLHREKIGLRDEEVMNVLDAIKLPGQPHFVKKVAKPQSSPPASQDLLYSTMQQRRYAARKKRYESYPKEFQDLMKPIDEQYEKQTAECRTEMQEIRRQRADDGYPSTSSVVPPKRARAGFTITGPKQKRPPTDYAELAAQRLTDLHGTLDTAITGKQLTRVVPDAEDYKDVVMAAKNVYQQEIKQEVEDNEEMFEAKPEPGLSTLVPKGEVFEQPTRNYKAAYNAQKYESQFDSTFDQPQYQVAKEEVFEQEEEVDLFHSSSPKKVHREHGYY